MTVFPTVVTKSRKPVTVFVTRLPLPLLLSGPMAAVAEASAETGEDAGKERNKAG